MGSHEEARAGTGRAGVRCCGTKRWALLRTPVFGAQTQPRLRKSQQLEPAAPHAKGVTMVPAVMRDRPPFLSRPPRAPPHSSTRQPYLMFAEPMDQRAIRGAVPWCFAVVRQINVKSASEKKKSYRTFVSVNSTGREKESYEIKTNSKTEI